jgi:hypothetical protein
MIKKKQTVSPPARVVVKESYQNVRTAPQEVIMSETSIRGMNEFPFDSRADNRQTTKFYSPEYRAEVAPPGWQKSKSP